MANNIEIRVRSGGSEFDKFMAQWIMKNVELTNRQPFRIDATDTEWEEFQNRWRETHQGVSVVHAVTLLEAGGDE